MPHSQLEVDEVIIKLDGTPDQVASWAATPPAASRRRALQAGAASLGIPLYQHIGGVNAVTLPVPGVHHASSAVGAMAAAQRSGGKPSYSLYLLWLRHLQRRLLCRVVR